MKIFILLFIFLSQAFAQELDLPKVTKPYPTEKSQTPLPGTIPPEDSPFEQAVEEADPVKAIPSAVTTDKEKNPENKKSADLRDDSIGTVMLGYQLITTWVPSKKVLSYTHNFNHKWTLEGEYSWSKLSYSFFGVDLGKVSESKLVLMARYFPGNSFNYHFGAYYSDLEAEAGSDLLRNIAGTPTTSSFGVEHVGVVGGIGNRWQWDNGFTLGIDWFRLFVPVAITEVDSRILSSITNEDDDDDVKKVIKRLGRIPTFATFGIHLGYTF